MPGDPMPFEAGLAPVFSGFVRIAAEAARHAEPGSRDITYQRVLEGLIRSWREESRFMRRMKAFAPQPIPIPPAEPS